VVTRLFHHPLCLAMLVMRLIPEGSLKVQLSVIPTLSAKEEKIIVEWKLLCINQQMEYHMYMYSCQSFMMQRRRRN
jgi:hypothetical protein